LPVDGKIGVSIFPSIKEFFVRFAGGCVTPVASLLVIVGGIGYALSWIPAPTPNILESKLVLANLIAMAAAILFVGPGAFSLDARLFGRREIFIPNPSIRRNPEAR